LQKNIFKKYLLPGFVFQSVIIGGGYGTGREIVEFFLSYGPGAGLLGMLLITTLVWAVFLALTFEFTRIFKAYNYKIFFKRLLGKYWFIFELIFIIYVLLVLAVLSSASGVILRDEFNFPYFIGVIIMLLIVAFFTFKGSEKIEKFLAYWSFVLFAVYIVFLIVTIIKFGNRITESFATFAIKDNWVMSAFKYAFYNLANVIGVIFCVKHIETRKEAISAGIIGGIIGIIPAILLHISLSAYFPEILEAEIPSALALKNTGITALSITFQIVLFGTLIETGVALMHAFNERVFSSDIISDKKRSAYLRPLITVSFILFAIALSSFGIIDLIAKGYGMISWGFLLVFLLPLATIGLYKIIKS